MKLFHICTIANKFTQYEEMKSSFLQAGFDEDRCRYSLFDNSKSNIYDPYETFNKIKLQTSEPYIIFCHQDILLNQGNGFDDLVKVLTELEKLDPTWAVAGNAGINNDYKFVARITDPNDTPNWLKDFPQQVHSLDENFLVIKTAANISCSSDLKGFHFYATDLCLNAIYNGYSCYVIDFHLTHLSGGNKNQVFWDIQKTFYRKWNDKFSFCYVQTVTDVSMCLSKHAVIRAIFSRHKLRKLLLFKLRLNRLLLPQPRTHFR